MSISAQQRGNIAQNERSGTVFYIRLIILASGSMFNARSIMRNGMKMSKERVERSNAKLIWIFAYANGKRTKCGRALSK